MYQLGSSPFFDDKGNEIGEGGSEHLPLIGEPKVVWQTPHGNMKYDKRYWENNFSQCFKYNSMDACWGHLCDEYGFAEGEEFCRPLASEGIGSYMGACGPSPMCKSRGEKKDSGHSIKVGKSQMSLGGLALAGIAYLVFFKK